MIWMNELIFLKIQAVMCCSFFVIVFFHVFKETVSSKENSTQLNRGRTEENKLMCKWRTHQPFHLISLYHISHLSMWPSYSCPSFLYCLLPIKKTFFFKHGETKLTEIHRDTPVYIRFHCSPAGQDNERTCICWVLRFWFPAYVLDSSCFCLFR